jgi:hypothetical protein
MSKKIKLKNLKSRQSYTTRQLAQTLDVHVRTVQTWKGAGLKPIENTVPLLFMGFEVKDFIQKRQTQKKITLAKNQFYCVKCRKAVLSKNNKIEIIETQKLIGKDLLQELILRGECELCGSKLNRFSHIGKLDEVKQTFEIERRT